MAPSKRAHALGFNHIALEVGDVEEALAFYARIVDFKLRGKEKKTLYVPAIESRDHMDEMLDAVNPENSLIPRLGVLAVDITDELRTRLGGALRIPSGVIVVGRAADLIMPDTGLQAADVIHQLNTTPIDSVETLRTTVGALKPGDPVVLQVERDGGLLYVSFELEQ